MISWLLDTSILVRLENPGDPTRSTARQAILALRSRGDLLCVTPQVLIEFRAVATRPLSANGLGQTGPQADLSTARSEVAFGMLPDTPAVFPAWRRLVAAAGVLGKQVHDARIAAVCAAHGVTRLLTFNVRDFTRFSPVITGFAPVDPADVAAGRA